jgi:dipeptidyl aminopeptidase/acylaminoacyl peptidase
MDRVGGVPISAAMVARSRAVAEPGWSPDGRHLAWLEGVGAESDVVVAPADGSGPSMVVNADAPVGAVGAYAGGAWCWAGPEHLALAAADGSLVLVPAAGGPTRVLSREGRAAAPSATVDGTRIAFVLEGDDACGIAIVPADGSAAPTIVSNADYAWDPSWSPDGARLAWHEWDLARMSWDGSRIVVAAGDGSGAQVVAGGDDIAVSQPRFAPDGHALAYVSDQSGWWNVYVAHPDGAAPRRVLAEPHEHAEPSWGPGQRSFAWSPDSRELAINRNEDGFARLVVVGRDGGQPRVVSKGWHHSVAWGPSGIACVRSGARTPTAITVLDPDGGRRVVARGPVAGFEAAGLIEPEPITWHGDDGAPVHGLLYRPAGNPGPTAGAAPPLLVDVHGGPSGQATVTWNARVHFFVTRGWAVLAPNHRGSTGYGRDYTQALAREWGALDVADTAAGIREAGARGWCDPARVAIMGGSAGGLTTLLLCAHHPELVRAAVSLYGVTDLRALAATTHRFESRYLDRIVGVLPDDDARYDDRSPITHAASIRAPLLVLHGGADKVVPAEQASSFVAAVRAAGGTVEHHVYEHEGHGWSGRATIADALTRTEEFLRRWVLST